MRLEIFSRGGSALILRLLLLELARTLMRSRMPASTTASWECLADSRPCGHCSGEGSDRETQLSSSCSRLKNRPGLASAAWGAGCFQEHLRLFPSYNLNLTSSEL